MSVNELVKELVIKLEQGGNLPPALYLANKKGFDPEKDWIYYSGPTWDKEEIAAGVEAFLTGKWLVSGESVAAFEKAFSAKYGFASSVMVNSGSSANLVMVAALKKHFNWQDGDEVIVSPVGFPTTIAPIVQNNLKVVFVDITFDDLNFDLNMVEKAISEKTRAIFLSPVLGNAPDMDYLQEIAAKKDVLLVLDGCDSLGSRWRGKELSEFAYVTSGSFYPAHHITTGEGGMVSSNDKKLVHLARSFAWWGRDCFCVGAANLSSTGACKHRFGRWLDGYDGKIDHKYLFTNRGYNLKPLDMQGAIGLKQLEKVDEIHKKRRLHKNRIEAIFKKHLGDEIDSPQENENSETSWFGVPLICKTRELKDKLVEYLEANRIQTRNYFAGNILLHPAYKDLGDAAEYPNANKVLEQVFFVGCHSGYQEEMFEYFDRVLKEFVESIT
ncbi:MAG: aminotransferase class V-fold PLP-dependent enzyme [Proteobacteria bacterium]|nr:aminotransferase class V-fold PLP-dependent enzyme [Pseudomonadota bacterium]MBU1739809.1 aminotransferase class V-fold PLP-dependent enzyme [Pseudomonadota bacterium]